jgi:predicted esterase
MGKHRTLLLLHGTGGDEQDLIPLGQRLSPNSALLSPRGRVLENGMPRFFRRVAEGVFDQQDLELQTHALAAFVQVAAQKYEFEESELIAVGYSNGANIASSLMLRHPGLLAGAVLFRPMVPFVPRVLPDLREKEIFLGAAERDQIVERRETQQLADLFQRAGAAVTFHWHPGGHELGEDDVVAAANWISESLR